MNRSVAFLAALCNTGPAWAQNLSPQIGYHNTGYIVGYHNTGETVGELGSVGPAWAQNMQPMSDSLDIPQVWHGGVCDKPGSQICQTHDPSVTTDPELNHDTTGPVWAQNAVNDPSHVCSTDMQSPCREAPATAIHAYPTSGSSVTPPGYCPVDLTGKSGSFLYQCDSPSVPTDPDLTRALAICQTHHNDSHGITTLPITHWSDDYREDCEAVWAAYASRELDAVKARESTNKGWLHQYAEKLKQKDVKP